MTYNKPDPELPRPLDWVSPEEVEQADQAVIDAEAAIMDAIEERKAQIKRLAENGEPNLSTFPKWSES
jgi:hypothetical protein